MPLLFDSHLDLAWNAVAYKRDLQLSLDALNKSEAMMDDTKFRGRATISLPEMQKAGVAVCLATMMARVPYGDASALHTTLDYSSHVNAYAYAQGQLAYYRILERMGVMRFLTDKASLREHWQAAEAADNLESLPLGIILAMEGCDSICDPSLAEHWFECGLRCASLVHYGVSKYASGTDADGPVTPAGRELLDQFSRLGIVLDTTHLCDQSFDQALDHFEGPVLASHQNCRQLVPGQRQFSDAQIKRLIERGGILGLAFDAWMMYPGGWERGVTNRDVVTIDAALDHVDHICQLSGNDRHVAIGSDLDGGFGTEQCPTGLETIADLRKLAPGLSDRGYSDESIARIFGVNWLEFFEQHLPG